MILPDYHSNGERRRQMTILKVIEVLTDSNKSWEDAAQEAIREAAKTVENIRSIYIKDFQAVVENNKITKYRVNAKISFEIR
jgi:flavin-binding protein dodecin